jgi:hypothetical protein
VRSKLNVLRLKPAMLLHAPEVLKNKADGINPSRRDTDVRRIGSVPVRVNEKSVPSRRERRECEPANAVWSRRCVGGARIVARCNRHYRIMRQRAAGVGERSYHSTESGAERRSLRQLRCGALGANPRRAATEKEIGVFGRGVAASGLCEHHSE